MRAEIRFCEESCPPSATAGSALPPVSAWPAGMSLFQRRCCPFQLLPGEERSGVRTSEENRQLFSARRLEAHELKMKLQIGGEIFYVDLNMI